MASRISRRTFMTRVGAGVAASALLTEVNPLSVLAAVASQKGQPRSQAGASGLYPPADLTYFEKPITPLPAEIRFGYAAITWGGNDRQAIEDVAALGFKGIQLRSNVLKEFETKPEALRELLARHRLMLVALSSGGLNIERPASEELATHTAHAKFVQSVGGLYLQVTDQRPKGRAVTRDDYKRLGSLLTELGKRTSDYGILLGYHNHMNALGEAPEEVDWILEAADPHFAKLELDIAHYQQGGGDPAKVIERYGDRLLFLHIKDVESLPPSDTKDAKHSYRFVELGRGRVDLPAVFGALKKVGFRGWAVIELDAVPDKSRTPKDAAMISKKYVEEKLGHKIN